MGREDKRLEMYFEDGGWGHEPRRARGLEKLKKTTDKTLFEPNLQNCEMINLCCFKPLRLQQFITKAMGNLYQYVPQQKLDN